MQTDRLTSSLSSLCPPVSQLGHLSTELQCAQQVWCQAQILTAMLLFASVSTRWMWIAVIHVAANCSGFPWIVWLGIPGATQNIPEFLERWLAERPCIKFFLVCATCHEGEHRLALSHGIMTEPLSKKTTQNPQTQKSQKRQCKWQPEWVYYNMAASHILQMLVCIASLYRARSVANVAKPSQKVEQNRGN